MADAVGLATELDEPPVVDGRSITAAAIRSSPNTDPHLLSSGFVVIAADRFSWASAKARKSGLAPSASGGRNPSSSMTSRRALPMGAAHPAGLPVVAGAPHAHHERGRREEARLEPPLARQRAEGRRHVRLAGADVTHEHEVLPALDEAEREQRLAPHALRPRHGRSVVAVEGLGLRQRALSEQRRALRGLAAGPLRLEAARQVLHLLRGAELRLLLQDGGGGRARPPGLCGMGVAHCRSFECGSVAISGLRLRVLSPTAARKFPKLTWLVPGVHSSSRYPSPPAVTRASLGSRTNLRAVEYGPA